MYVILLANAAKQEPWAFLVREQQTGSNMLNTNRKRQIISYFFPDFYKGLRQKVYMADDMLVQENANRHQLGSFG